MLAVSTVSCMKQKQFLHLRDITNSAYIAIHCNTTIHKCVCLRISRWVRET